MDTHHSEKARMPKAGSTIFSKKLFILTLGGGLVFWATTIATSLLPIAAEYRAAFTNWKIQTVWVDSLLAGLIIGCGVSYFLLRSLNKIPTKNPILESASLSFVALVIATILIDVPRSLLTPGPGDPWYYFLVGLMFNAARFLLLGFVIGYLCKSLYGSV
jgi:hypothetical protein